MRNVTTTLLLTAALTIIMFCCCSIDNTEIKATVTKHSACKSSGSAAKEESVPDSVSKVSYIYDPAGETLLLTHSNAGFNCCPDRFYCSVSLSSDTLIITEMEQSTKCRCNCLYDIDISVQELKAGCYMIKLVEPYAGLEKPIIFRADLTSCPEGSFSVIRHRYPWNG